MLLMHHAGKGKVLLLQTHDEERQSGSSERQVEPVSGIQVLFHPCPLHQPPGTQISLLSFLVPTPSLKSGQTNICHLSDLDDISPKQRDQGPWKETA